MSSVTSVFTVTSMSPWPCRYLESRGLLEGRGPPQVPSLPSPAERDAAYLGWALEGWPGRSGHDAPMVALEALLAAGGCWEDLCARGVLHGGDNDSTGTIASGCWGLQGGGLAPVPPGCTAASSTVGDCTMLPTASTRWPGGDADPPCTASWVSPAVPCGSPG